MNACGDLDNIIIIMLKQRKGRTAKNAAAQKTKGPRARAHAVDLFKFRNMAYILRGEEVNAFFPRNQNIYNISV